MPAKFHDNLARLGISLPEAPAPAANYVPYVITGDLVFVSGQLAVGPEGMIIGKLGETLSIDEGQNAARLCAINLIAQLNIALIGDLSRLVRVVRLGGFVNATPEFSDHPKVINGASDLIVDVFEDAGKHARAAVGSPSLPFGVAVEIDGIFQIR